MNYGVFVQIAVRVNLQRLVPKRKVWHHCGMLLESRAFAVPIDKKEASTSSWFLEVDLGNVVAVAEAESWTQDCQESFSPLAASRLSIISSGMTIVLSICSSFERNPEKFESFSFGLAF